LVQNVKVGLSPTLAMAADTGRAHNARAV